MKANLETRYCKKPKCGNSFSVSPHHKQEYCSKSHEYDHLDKIDPKGKKKRNLKRAQLEWNAQNTYDIIYSSPKNQKQELAETTALYGTRERGDRPPQFANETNKSKSTGNATTLKLAKTNNEKKSTTPTRTLEKKKLSGEKNIIKTIKSARSQRENEIVRKIERPIMSTRESTTKKTETNSSSKLSKPREEFLEKIVDVQKKMESGNVQIKDKYGKRFFQSTKRRAGLAHLEGRLRGND